MADITWTNVTDAAPELASVSTNQQNAILSYVNNDVDCDFFGGVDDQAFFLARVYLAAHTAALPMLMSGALTGAITGNTEGQVEQTYAAIALVRAQGDHIETGYGRAYDALVRSSPNRVGFAT